MSAHYSVIIFFVLSMVVSIFYLIKVVSIVVGKTMTVPVPVLHLWGIEFSNAYVSTPALGYQVYFWAQYFGLFGA